MRAKMKPWKATLAVIGVLAVGCARSSASGGTPLPGGSPQLVLRIDLTGGFITPETLLRRVPTIALYDDGRLVLPGPQIEIYPGPALPNLQVRHVSAAGIRAILAAAADAGLLGPDRRLDAPAIADAPTTVFTVVTDGVRHVVSVQALGIDPGPGASPGDAEARAKLSAFETKLTTLDSWLPSGSIGPERSFVPDELRFYALSYRPAEDLPQKPHEWPLGSLQGLPALAGNDQVRCGTVSGQALGSVLALAGTANELTPWKADGQRWSMVFRPLLPDESGCGA
jgi:hypothetical protein